MNEQPIPDETYKIWFPNRDKQWDYTHESWYFHRWTRWMSKDRMDTNRIELTVDPSQFKVGFALESGWFDIQVLCFSVGVEW